MYRHITVISTDKDQKGEMILIDNYKPIAITSIFPKIPNNYRVIDILSCVSKIVTSVVFKTNYVNNHCEQTDFFH